jgi:UDP-3-O-[3-hydroxymyristoyl] glucosamine N-acyltransferase
MFYLSKISNSITLKKILDITNSSINPEFSSFLDHECYGVNSLSEANNADITFLHNIKYVEQLKSSKAFACFVSLKQENLVPSNIIAIRNENPYLAFAKLVQFFYGIHEIDKNKNSDPSFISPSASIHSSVTLGKNVKIYENVVIGSDVKIGDDVTINPNTVIGHKVEIGSNSFIHDNCSVMFSKIGESCTIRSGSRIGISGFGFAPNLKTGEHEYLPQISGVRIGKNVDIGANTVIDRGSFSDTEIYDNVKIDNLVQIGHGVKIGKSSIITGQCGFGGSAEIGEFCFVGPQSGFVSHVKVAPFSSFVGRSGVLQDIKIPGRTFAGFPALEKNLWQRLNIKLKNLLIKKNI